MHSLISPKRALFTALFILSATLAGCGGGHHAILGASVGWDRDNVQILLDAKVSDLRIRHVRMKNTSCLSGHSDHLEIDGKIGPDSTAAVERLLPKLNECATADGKRIVNIVYLSSGGGYLSDGYSLGELFRKYRVQTVVTNGQECASSCAIAFLGGKFRSMYGDAVLLFHAPYTGSGIAIDCTDKSDMTDLQNYYQNQLGSKDGEFLFDRTMSYCSTSSGWTLNADGAKLFGITTN
jgi:ATP-dependent protease ClpP protease subunit